MIGSLRGKLISRRPDNVIVEAGGVGYQVNVPSSILSNFPAEGSTVFLNIYTHVREDALQLYGFATEDEKRIFTTLLGVTGIGPKMALNILSGISHDDFMRAIEEEDVALLCRIPGLGKKTAHRLILELREKLPSLGKVRDKIFDDTLSALVNLGYKKAEAIESLEMAYKKGYKDIETLVKESLKYLTGNANDS
ncbi:MAG: Holliday junction branch migration protein RuvA [Nitrospirota bacterium]